MWHAIFLDIDTNQTYGMCPCGLGWGMMIFLGFFGPWDAGSFLQFLWLELSFLNSSVMNGQSFWDDFGS